MFDIKKIRLSLHSLLREEFIEEVDYNLNSVVKRCKTSKRKIINYFQKKACLN
jgi:hypothetical protein